MNSRRRRGSPRSPSCLLACLAMLAGHVHAAVGIDAAPASNTAADTATLARIRDAAMHSDWAYERLSDLTDRIGPRLAGSPQLGAAERQVSDVLRSLGARVTLQPVKVPHWVRGDAQAELVEYPGRPAGVTQHVVLTALGSSGATGATGLTARIIIVRSVEELQARSAEVPGNIVLFYSRFDQRQADGGHAMDSYMEGIKLRLSGPSTAASMGASAALIRSVGGAEFRLPHTGSTVWKDHQTHIPTAALAVEDADLIARLAVSGPVTIKLTLTPKTLPDADANNVIADWVGREKPDEYVIVSGHLDSWDLATGATDDGGGLMAAAAVIQLMQQLGLHPRRTIRFIGWTNEENGFTGRHVYFQSVSKTLNTQTAAIESDLGQGHALGISMAAAGDAGLILQPVVDTLSSIGAGTLMQADLIGPDVQELQAAGIPTFAPLVSTQHYFDDHHTAADTLDKVDPQNLRAMTATMGVLAYYLAEVPEPIKGMGASR